MKQDLFKVPKTEVCIGRCMFVPHDETKNVALDATPESLNLKPNGLTVDDMQQNAEFNRVGDTLDKAAVASKISSSLAQDTKKTINALKALEKQSKKQLKH